MFLVFTFDVGGTAEWEAGGTNTGGSRRDAPGRLAKAANPYPGPWSTPGLYVLNSMGKNDS